MKAGDRKTLHSGKTMRQERDHIKIEYDAELSPPGWWQKLLLSLHYCSIVDKERSYLYLRENSIETNEATSVCCGVCLSMDFINVTYFDRAPYKKSCKPSPQPCCCLFNVAQPKLEVVNKGCYCCFSFIKCGTVAVVMPFENFPFPFCWCPNRTGWWSNCFGLCGPSSGNPIVYQGFSPQPRDAQSFVDAARPVMLPGCVGAECDDANRKLVNVL